MSGRNAVAFEARTEAELRTPGGYRFYVLHQGGPRVGICHSCPCGCRELGSLWFKDCAPRREGQPHDEWTVTGEWPKVTLSPSIGFKKGDEDGTTKPYHWHGFLREGVFEEG